MKLHLILLSTQSDDLQDAVNRLSIHRYRLLSKSCITNFSTFPDSNYSNGFALLQVETSTIKKQIAMNITADKLNMYKAVETVCASNHTKWNDSQEFRGAFSRFAVKVAQLDLLSGNDKPLILTSENSGQLVEYVKKLIFEIDRLLDNSIDALVRFLRPEHHEFYTLYVSARSRC